MAHRPSLQEGEQYPMPDAPKVLERNLRSGNNWRARNLLGSLAVFLGLISLALPLVAYIGLEEPGVPFDHPARVAYYQQIVLGFVLGVVFGLVALLLGRRSPARLFKIPSIVLGAGGLVISLLLLLVLVGLCGPTVLWGLCRP